MTLLNDPDVDTLTTDPTIVIQTSEGHSQKTIPFRFGPTPVSVRRDSVVRPSPPHYVPPISVSGQNGTIPQSTVTPISIPAQLKKMHSSITHTSLRISSNGGMRPSISQGTHSHLQPPATPSPTTNVVNGVHSRPPDAHASLSNPSPSMHNGDLLIQAQVDMNSTTDGNVAAGQMLTPSRPKSQNQHSIPNLPNGYHVPQMNGFQPPMVNGGAYLHHTNPNGLSPAQLSQLKSTFPGTEMAAAIQNGGRLSAQYMNHVASNGVAFNMQQVVGSNLSLKIPGVRQMQWPGPTPQRTNNALDASGLNGALSPSLGHALPVRTPSANSAHVGLRVSSVGHTVPLSHSISPRLHHTPSPLPQRIAQISANQRQSQTLASPPVQHQQTVGTQGGY